MRKRLGEILIEQQTVTPVGVHYALIRQKQWGHRIGRCLLDMRQCSEQDIVRALSAQLGLPAVTIGDRHVPTSLLELVPAETARELGVIPVGVVPGRPRATLRVAMARPWDSSALETLRRVTGFRINALIAGDLDLAGALRRFYPRSPVSDAPDPVIETAPAEPADTPVPGIQPVPAWEELSLPGK